MKKNVNDFTRIEVKRLKTFFLRIIVSPRLQVNKYDFFCKPKFELNKSIRFRIKGLENN